MKKLFLPLIIVLSTILPACGNSSASEEQASEPSQTSSVIENIMSRRSIRKYTEERVPREILDTILVCGINAPNGMNQQSYEVKVVDDPESCAFLAETVNGLYKAPVYLFIASGTNYDMSPIDVGLLAENVGLAAWSYGIGSICLGMPVRAIKDEHPELLEQLGFGDGYNFCMVMALGYPAEKPDAKPRNKDKIQFITIK